jgi:hypothetical protein
VSEGKGRGKYSRKKPGGNSTKQQAQAWLESSPELSWSLKMPGESGRLQEEAA